MGVAISEQETTIHFMRDSDTASVYTSDTTVMTRLDKLAADEGSPYWTLEKVHHDRNGNVVSKVYGTKKRLVSFRRDVVARPMTEEQKAAARNRLLAARKAVGHG